MDDTRERPPVMEALLKMVAQEIRSDKKTMLLIDATPFHALTKTRAIIVFMKLADPSKGPAKRQLPFHPNQHVTIMTALASGGSAAPMATAARWGPASVASLSTAETNVELHGLGNGSLDTFDLIQSLHLMPAQADRVLMPVMPSRRRSKTTPLRSGHNSRTRLLGARPDRTLPLRRSLRRIAFHWAASPCPRRGRPILGRR